MLIGILHDTNGNFDGTRLDGFKRWIEAANFKIMIGNQFGETLELKMKKSNPF
jgi:hypothetical protein